MNLNSPPKIAVYMIVKNGLEELQRGFWSVIKQEQKPDAFIIVDTGSTDYTVGMLKDYKMSGEQFTLLEAFISPWRFDDARNLAMSAIPEDIDLCISLDADEVLAPDFIKQISEAWTAHPHPKPTRFNHSFTTIWDWDKEGKNISQHFHERVHARFGYRWIHPVHEKLVSAQETVGWCTAARITQMPDMSKDRTVYLPLLQQAVIEDPTDWKLWSFLAGELSNQKQDYLASRDAYEKALVQPQADKPWLYLQLALLAEQHNNLGAAKSYFQCALTDNPTREMLLYTAEFWSRRELGLAMTISYYKQALEITNETMGYMRREDAWNGTIEARLNILNQEQTQ